MAKQNLENKLMDLEDKITEQKNRVDVLEQKIMAMNDEITSKISEISKLLELTEQDYYDIRHEVVEKLDVFTANIKKQIESLKDSMVSITNVVLKNYKDIEHLKNQKESKIKDKG